jgi:hypothetical protein
VLAFEVPRAEELADPSGRPVQHLSGLLDGVELARIVIPFHVGSIPGAGVGR